MLKFSTSVNQVYPVVFTTISRNRCTKKGAEQKLVMNKLHHLALRPVFSLCYFALCSLSFAQADLPSSDSNATLAASKQLPTVSKPVTQANQLLNNYLKIDSLSCEIRKTTKSKDHTLRILSRIQYRKPDHIHVENISPFKRTIVADGKNLYYYQQSFKRGFSRPINKLSDTWLTTLKNVPGTPMEHLIKLRNTPEQELPPTSDGSRRSGYNVKKGIFVVLTVDRTNRITNIDFYKSPAMQKKTAEYVYSKQIEVMPCCWIPTRHKATLFLPADERVTETRIISNLSVNKKIPDQIFNHELFFKDIEFTDDFQRTYQ